MGTRAKQPTRPVPVLTVGDRIVIARRHAGLDQKDLAEHVGVTHQAVGHWESNRTDPNLSACKRIAEITGVSVAWLAFGEDGLDLLSTDHEVAPTDRKVALAAA